MTCRRCKDELRVGSGTSDVSDDGARKSDTVELEFDERDGGRLGSGSVIQKAKDGKEGSRDVCVGRGIQDDLVVFTAGLFSQLCA